MQVLDLHISTLSKDPPKHEPVYDTREYSTPPPCVVPDGFIGWVYATLTISHSQCVVIFSHNGIAKVSGLPEYVAGTVKSQPRQVYNDIVLNRYRWGTT
jgi:hypothetical protein